MFWQVDGFLTNPGNPVINNGRKLPWKIACASCLPDILRHVTDTGGKGHDSAEGHILCILKVPGSLSSISGRMEKDLSETLKQV